MGNIHKRTEQFLNFGRYDLVGGNLHSEDFLEPKGYNYLMFSD